MIIRAEKIIGIVFEVVTWFNVETDVRLMANHECGLYETVAVFGSIKEANEELNRLILSI